MITARTYSNPHLPVISRDAELLTRSHNDIRLWLSTEIGLLNARSKLLLPVWLLHLIEIHEMMRSCLKKKKKKNFTSFCQPTRPITCANYGNHVQIFMKRLEALIRSQTSNDSRGFNTTQNSTTSIDEIYTLPCINSMARRHFALRLEISETFNA